MCAIVGSLSAEKLRELVALNSYRGSHSYSYSLYDPDTGVLSIVDKGLGSINVNKIVFPDNLYGIVHVQAPTTEARSEEFIHPAIIPNIYSKQTPRKALWHNGIVKAHVIERYSRRTCTSWDTMQILRLISENNAINDWDVLSNIDGTFSCLYYDETNTNLFLFRNEISPMFIDKELNISSTKFEGSAETPPNQVLRMDFVTESLHNEYNFETVENPYYFGD
jgi:hypothetical protein